MLVKWWILVCTHGLLEDWLNINNNNFFNESIQTTVPKLDFNKKQKITKMKQNETKSMHGLEAVLQSLF